MKHPNDRAIVKLGFKKRIHKNASFCPILLLTWSVDCRNQKGSKSYHMCLNSAK